jgi:signal transduction histidine kinase
MTVCSLLSALILLLTGNASAGELIKDRAFFVDDSLTRTLADVSRENLTPYSGVLTRGFTKSAVWVRLEVIPPKNASPEDDIVVRIRPVFLDEIQLFDPLDTSGKPRIVGDTTPISASEFPSLSHTFVIPSGSEPRAIWLRLRSTSTTLMTVEAMTRTEMTTSELNLNIACFIAMAIMAMFVMLAVINWPGKREKLYQLFVARQIFYLMYIASLFGLHRFLLRDLDPHLLDFLYSLIVVGVTTIALLFEREFLSKYSSRPFAKLLMNGLLCWSGLAIGLMIFGDVGKALKTNMTLNAVGIASCLLIAITSVDQHKQQTNPNEILLSKKLIISYYIALSVVLMFSALPILGIFHANDFVIAGFVFFTLSTSLIMTAMMLIRENQQRLVHAEYGKKLLLSEQRVWLEKNKRDEQSHLFHMLMHEIKNPLAVIDMALVAKNDQQTTSAYVSRAINNIKRILDRCVKADKLGDGNVETDPVAISLSEFIRQHLDGTETEQNKIVIRIDNSLTVTADKHYLSVIFNNLFDNALRYGDLLEPICVDARAKANHAGQRGVVVTVSNRPGFAGWPDPDKVFKKYYRSAGAEAKSGTGLGLYLIRTLAHLMGGECNYVPDEKNIAFELWLPT